MSPASNLDTSLRGSIRTHLSELLQCLQGDTNSFKSFLKKLSTINDTIQTHRHKLQGETLASARNFAGIVDAVVQGILELDQKNVRLYDETTTDLSEILEEKMGKLQIQDQRPMNSTNSSSHPAYIKPSYTWLLSNLHNPYPSKEVKKDICRQTHCSVSDINAWFIDARKRIGWNKLRKSKFSNKQEAIIAAATQIFQTKPSSFSGELTTGFASEMNSHEVYRPDFLMIARNARSLYAGRYPDISAPPNTVSLKEAHDLAEREIQYDISGSSRMSYPTPEPSPPHYTVEVLPPPSPSILAADDSKSRKRPQSDDDEGHDQGRPSKRTRFNVSEGTQSPPMVNMPSPCTTVDLSASDEADVGPSSPEVVHVTIPTPPLPETRSLKRKRRFSDGETQGRPKRPHNILCTSRLQTVSDPLPLIKPVDLLPWEHHLTDSIPTPLNIEDPIIFTSPINVGFYQYNSPPYTPEELSSELDALTSELDPLFPVEDSNHSIIEPLSFADVFQDADCHFNNVELEFNLDPSRSLSYDHLDASNDPVLLLDSELFSSTPGYLPESSPWIGDSCKGLNCLDTIPMTSLVKTPVFGSFDHAASEGSLQNEEQAAKRVRAQALRRELAQLAAEGL